MLDGLDENLRLIHYDRARTLRTAVWASRYAVGQKRAVALNGLTELKSPHLDLVTDFCRRAATRHVGKSCVVLTGPEEFRYAAEFIDFTDAQPRRRPEYSGRTPEWLRKWGERNLTAKNLDIAAQVEHVNNALLRDGLPAKKLDVPLGTWTDGVANTITVFVTTQDLYQPAGVHPEWGCRAELAKQYAPLLQPRTNAG